MLTMPKVNAAVRALFGLLCSTSFSGLRLLSQAFVLDTVAADGFTATRAVETWIR